MKNIKVNLDTFNSALEKLLKAPPLPRRKVRPTRRQRNSRLTERRSS